MEKVTEIMIPYRMMKTEKGVKVGIFNPRAVVSVTGWAPYFVQCQGEILEEGVKCDKRHAWKIRSYKGTAGEYTVTCDEESVYRPYAPGQTTTEYDERIGDDAPEGAAKVANNNNKRVADVVAPPSKKAKTKAADAQKVPEPSYVNVGEDNASLHAEVARLRRELLQLGARLPPLIIGNGK